MGMRVIEEDGARYAVKCECTYVLRGLRALERANIPRQYEGCTFENFDVDVAPLGSSLASALAYTKRFVDKWEDEEVKKGLLLTGAVGVGKTHLAVATLRSLISKYNARGLFYDHKALLKAIQNTYDKRSLESELDVLGPVFKADVLVLDELGRENRTEWAGEMIEHILNTRYNDRLTTIITTNFPNKAPHPMSSLRSDREKAEHATREVTLGDRVGQQIFSRLQEMCFEIRVSNQSWKSDYRQTMKKATPEAHLYTIRKYRTLRQLHDGLQLYQPGQIIELSDEDARSLLDDKVIEIAALLVPR